MLAHRKRDRFRSRNAFNLHILGVLFVRDTYTASDFFYRFYYFRAHSSSSLYSFIYIMKLWHNGPQYASRDGPRNKSRQKKHRGIAYNRLSGNHNRGNRKLPCIMSQSRQNTYFYISCVFENLNNKYITRVLSTPPASDIKNAVTPRVRKTNSDFKSVTDSAGISPNSEAANITAILENLPWLRAA